MEPSTVKEEAKRMVEELPEDATWDDLMYKIYVRQSIESGLRDVEAGRVTEVHEVRARFGLERRGSIGPKRRSTILYSELISHRARREHEGIDWGAGGQKDSSVISVILV